MTPDILAVLQSLETGQNGDLFVLNQSLEKLDSATQGAIRAAAIPHWFDADFLSAILAEDNDAPRTRMDTLIGLSFVEAFPDGGYNIHDLSRKNLLKYIWETDRASFVAMSRKAWMFCGQRVREGMVWQIELIYHCLTADPQEGIKLLAAQAQRWKNEHFDDWVELLARTALEVAEGGRVSGEIANKLESIHAGLGLVYGQKEARLPDESGIVSRFLAGDKEAVETVNKYIERAAWPYQRRLSRQWDDVLQDVRLEVMRLLAQGKFRGESSLRTYLWRVVSHKCLDYVRSHRRWDLPDLETDIDDLKSPVGRYINQESENARLESRDLLSRVLGRVPEDCRSIWRLMVLGLSYREMSAKMGISEGTLRVRVLRCREKAMLLRRELSGGGGADEKGS
jgi:RNA polymerase sigma factor (sigma-70 family)